MDDILTQLIKKKLPEWNERVFSSDDLPVLCRRFECGYVTAPIGAKGEYIQHEGYPFIVIRERLKREMLPWVGFHELAHHLLHYPSEHKFSKSVVSKADREANLFAAIALMPTAMCRVMSPAEIIAEYDYPKELVAIRLEISQYLQI